MLLVVLLSVAAQAGEAAAPDSTPLAAFTQEAAGWLLEGKRLPPDYRLRLLGMAPAERLQAIIFLRRAGLLTDAAWSLSDILKPAATQEIAR